MHLLPRMKFMLYFICMDSVELQGTRSKRKLQNDKLSSKCDSNSRPQLTKETLSKQPD